MRSQQLPAARQGMGFHSRALPITRTCPAHAVAGQITVPLRETVTTLTPLAGILTFSWVANITRRGRAPVAVRCRALERREPPTIIPNHPRTSRALAARPASPL